MSWINDLLDILSNVGNAGSDTLKSVVAKLGNIARTGGLAAELGSRWNTSGDLGTDIATIIAGLGGTGFAGDGVYIDSVNGTAGGAGTPSSPVQTLAQAVVIATANKLTKIYLGYGVITLTGNISGYEFIGNGFADPEYNYANNIFDVNGHTVTQCAFKDIIIEATSGGTLQYCGSFENCPRIEDLTLIDNCSDFINCGVILTITTLSNCWHFVGCGVIGGTTIDTCKEIIHCRLNFSTHSSVNMVRDCYVENLPAMDGCFDYNGVIFGAGAAMTDCYDFVECTFYDGPTTLAVAAGGISMQVGGFLTLMSLASGVDIIQGTKPLTLTIDVTCTGGTVNVYGDVKIINNSAGTLVNDYTGKPQAEVPVNIGAINTFETPVLYTGPMSRLWGTKSGPFDLGEAVSGTGGAGGIVVGQGATWIDVGKITSGPFLPTDTVTGATSSATIDGGLVVSAVTSLHSSIDKLRIKSVDPTGAETVTVKLYELINSTLVLVSSWVIDTSNYTTFFSLMDMFGVDQLSGDDLEVTVLYSAAGPKAVTGSYTIKTE
jgi:hypothetical protein